MEKNKNINKEIYNIALDLIRLMGIYEEEVKVTSIKKQYKNIDVLIEINNKYNIIIEDKTFTSQHSNQINRYKQVLLDENKENIICVYYKIVEQSFKEEGVINITRKDILNILIKYNTSNNVIEDYKNYLKWIDDDVNAYKNTPIINWKLKYKHTYRGFFTHLVDNSIIENSRFKGWSYINNPSGGIWGLWWYFIDNNILEEIGLKKVGVDELYLQIEDNKIAIKLKINKNISKENRTKIKDIRVSLYNYFNNVLENTFNKNKYHYGECMTVGYVYYDETNYKEKIKLMENVMKTIENKKYTYVSIYM